MRFLLSLITVLSMSSTLYAELSIEQLQAQILLEHGLTVDKVRRSRDNLLIKDSQYRSFLISFIKEANKKKLTPSLHQKRVLYPLESFLFPTMSVHVHCESRCSFSSRIFSKKLKGVQLLNNNIAVGHESAASLVTYLIEHFPVEGSEQARIFLDRNKTVRSLIVKIAKDFKSKGIRLYSDEFATSFGDIGSLKHLVYKDQEELLSALILFQQAFNEGYFFRNKIIRSASGRMKFKFQDRKIEVDPEFKQKIIITSETFKKKQQVNKALNKLVEQMVSGL